MNDVSGLVFAVHRGGLHDGPGIRTTIFFQGCPLRCKWCHNPESWAIPWRTNEETKATEWTASKLVAVAERDRTYFDYSGGGITASGGEPTLQPEFLLSLFNQAKDRGIGTCLDTCGAFSKKTLELILPVTDVFLFDYKATGEEAHRDLTGVSSRGPLERLSAILSAGKRVILRCPIVPGCNDSPEHFSAISKLSRRVEKVEVMPYHASGAHKYGELGLPYRLEGLPSAPRSVAESWLAQLRNLGANNVALG